MSLAEFIAATQAEMKSRIEEECRRQMLALLEDSFSKKWDEYTDKAVAGASAVPLYGEGYGRLDIDSIPVGSDGITDAVKTELKLRQKLYTFSSKKVYFIHCIIKQNSYSGSPPSSSTDVCLIDNHGFPHQIHSGSAPVKIDITKPVIVYSGACALPAEQYIYPLSNALIDMIKAMPYSVTGSYQSSNSWGTNHSPGGDIQSLVKNLPQIRKAAALFTEQTVALDALKKENAELKARIRAMEAASPSEDLLGLEAAAAETEPAKTLADLKPAGK